MAVDVIAKARGKKIPVRALKQKAQKILQLLRQDRAELSLALVGNREIQKLNARYRRKNQPTDVLSFASGDDLPDSVNVLGDVVISVEQAAKQAAKAKRGRDEELEILLIHGILHLLGYDHERSRREAKIMQAMERKIRRALCDENDVGV
jgi:probable rRNA maturation factor